MSEIDGPNKISIREQQKGIEKYSRVPVILAIAIFCALLLFLMEKQKAKMSELNVKKKTPSTNTSLLKPTQSETRWFDSESIPEKKNIFHNNRTEAEIEKQVINEQEIKLRKAVIEQEYQTKLEIEKIKQQRELEYLKKETEAYLSPLKIAIDPPPTSNQQENKNTGSRIDSQPSFIQPSMPTGGSGEMSEEERKLEFLQKGVSSGNYLPHLKEAAISKFEVKAGTIIPSALVSGLNSDLPGNVVAQVSQNVYDTVSGNYLLIPQGTKIIGVYDSNVSNAQNRALVVWTRLIYPDGKSINIERMQGVDMSGYAGLSDKTNNHYLRIYANALLLSAVGAGFELLNPNVATGDTQQTVAGNIGNQLAQVFNNTHKQNTNIKPTLEIRPGYKFNVMVMKDMILENLNND